MHSALLKPVVLSFVFWIFTSIGVLAQNGTVLSSDSLCNLPCPSGFHCFNNTIKTTVIELGHNGHICDGQSAEECYGETDPLGFVRGPRQIPQTVIQGDIVIFKPISITVNVVNVSRDTYYNCGSDGQQVHGTTSTSFLVPSQYLNPTGIKYFITTNVISCSFGIKLELYVRSRQEPGCLNPATPNLGVCSGAGLCASDAKTFFTRNYSCLCCNAYKGRYCEELDSCDASRNPCKNGATCTDLTDGIVDSFNCSCVPGYKGTFCEKNINECNSGPCQNGAFCSDSINSYTCLCTPGFEGENCDITIPDLCADNPCANGGTCLRSGVKRRNYTCTCLPNFTGRNCTVNIPSSSIQTSTLFSTTLVGNSTRFATQESFFSSVHTTRLTSTVPITSPMRTSTSQVVSSPTPSQRSSSVSVASKLVTSLSLSIQQSLSITETRNLVSTTEFSSSFSSAHTAFESSLPVVSSPKATLSSVLFLPTSVSSTFSQADTSSMATSESLSLVTTTTKSMESFSSKSSLTSSFVFTSSTSSPGPSPSPVTSMISSSSYSSLLLASSPVLTSTVGRSTGRSSIMVPSLTMLPSTITSTSSIRTTLPSLSTVYYTSTIRISPSMSTVLVSSSVMPTIPPTPTTPPLINQTCLHNPCNNGTCFNESYVGYEFRCECPHPTFGPVCTRGKC